MLTALIIFGMQLCLITGVMLAAAECGGFNISFYFVMKADILHWCIIENTLLNNSHVMTINCIINYVNVLQN